MKRFIPYVSVFTVGFAVAVMTAGLLITFPSQTIKTEAGKLVDDWRQEDLTEQERIDNLEETVNKLNENRKRGDPDLKLFLEAYHHIKKKHLNPDLKEKKLVEGAIQGMTFFGLENDSYSRYIGPADTKEMTEDYSGKFFGIGTSMSHKNGVIKIEQVYKGSPADKAGLKVGDTITEVDGKKVLDIGFNDAARMIRGEKGESVDLKVYRKGWSKPKIISPVRDEIKIIVSETKLIKRKGEKILYFRLDKFSDASVRDFRAALMQNAQEWKAGNVIIDLRNNPGGLTSAVRALAGAWLHPQDTVYITEGRDKTRTEMKVLPALLVSGMLRNTNTVILINKRSASCSEILAGALKDYGLATIVGETSHGKGVAQTVIPLSNTGSLTLTKWQWLTPKGRTIHKTGIIPNVEVKIPKETGAMGPKAKEKPDLQLKKAIEILLTD